ncbi:hypothetical protein PFISCL1PPCAC_7389, partial [Pristionchus fissidentatus]
RCAFLLFLVLPQVYPLTCYIFSTVDARRGQTVPTTCGISRRPSCMTEYEREFSHTYCASDGLCEKHKKEDLEKNITCCDTDFCNRDKVIEMGGNPDSASLHNLFISSIIALFPSIIL